MNFEYYTPTQVLFGKETEKLLGKLIQRNHYIKVLIHYGQDHVVKSKLLENICKQLQDYNIEYVTLGGVVPNARLSKVHEGIEVCKKEKVDCIIAVGGGSVIDSAKAIAFGYYFEGNLWDLFEKKAFPKKSLPVGVVLTHAASGSEMSNTTGITNDITDWMKRGCTSNLGRCVFAIMNPELTLSLPQYQTSCGCVDILSHTMERYFSKEESMELTDTIAEALMRTVIKYSLVLKDNPSDYKARAEIMWAGSLSHNGLTGCGTCGDWSCHQLEHALSGIFDVTHAAGLSALWGSWARYVVYDKPKRFERFAVQVMGVEDNNLDNLKKALLGIQLVEEYFKKLDMPILLSQLGLNLQEKDLEKLAYNCSYQNTRTIGNLKTLDYQDMLQIYKNAL